MRRIQSPESARDENAVLARQGNEIGDGAQRRQVEQRAQVKVLRAGQTDFTPALQQCVREFERKADGAELTERAAGVSRARDRCLLRRLCRRGAGSGSQLRIHQGRRGRRGMRNLMVVQHNHLDASLLKPVNRRHGCRAAIDCQQQLDGKFFETMFDSIPAQAVAFLQPARKVMIDLPAQHSQHLGQQRGRSHSVHIVISENDERLVPLTRPQQPLDGRGHVRQPEGIAQLLQSGLQEIRRAARFGQAAVAQALRQQRRDFEFIDQTLARQRLGRRDGPAKFHRMKACARREPRPHGESGSESSWVFRTADCSRRATITEKTIEVRIMEATTASEMVMGMSMSHAPSSIFVPMKHSTSDRPTLR